MDLPTEMHHAIVIVRQVDPKLINQYCQHGALGCYDKKNNIITIPKIYGPADRLSQCTLGHEMWHALGGTHFEK